MQINQQLGNMFRNGLLKIKTNFSALPLSFFLFIFYLNFLTTFSLFHSECALLARVLKTPGSRSKEWTYCMLHSR